MKMDDKKLKRLLQAEAEREADKIMEEVNSDPDLSDVVAPEAIHDKLFEQIRQYEEEKENEADALTAEQQELIRLGTIYKKKRSRRKYWVIAIAAVCAFALGMTSMGGAKKVFTEVKRILGEREQTVVNTGGEGRSFSEEISNEEQAYQQIEEKFSFWAVRMNYLPEGMEFVEADIEEEKQSACLRYADNKGGSITYRIFTNYRTGSIGIDVEDEFIQEYNKELYGVQINVKEYSIVENKTKRWDVYFEYENMQYSIMFIGLEEIQFEKILENLHFS